MSAKLFVIPASGLQVPDPAASGANVMLPPEGRSVDASAYWYRRIRHGDVTLREEPADNASSSDADGVKAGE